MPVIRGKPPATLPKEKHDALLRQLTNERAGQNTPDGPLIFEIPLNQPDRMDLLVVWDEFEGIRSEDRTGLILEAYGDQKESVAQALGVTCEEAMDQNLLPYAVVPKILRDETVPAEFRKAMLEEGALALADDWVELCFPTLAMAEEARERLREKLPHGYWSIVPSMASSN